MAATTSLSQEKHNTIQNHLAELKDSFEKMLSQKMGTLKPKNELTLACAYATSSGGKRWRPLLVLLIGKAASLQKYNQCEKSLQEAAMAVEMFHTASLIADDLPSMDDDDMRRGQMSTHKKFGEAVAIMASYALISEGYTALYRAASFATDAGIEDAQIRGLLAVESVAHNAGVQGATGGQFLDLNESKMSQEELLTVHRQKTASIFEISMVLGYLFGNGEMSHLPQVRELATLFGTSFQLIDDLEDFKKDAGQEEVNFAKVFGVELTQKKALNMLDEAQDKLRSLQIDSEEILFMFEVLKRKAMQTK